MTTLNVTGQAILDIIATIAWGTGRVAYHGENFYKGTRRLYRNEIASGALRTDFFTAANTCQDIIDNTLEAGDRFLNAWQSFSDDFRSLIWIFAGPLLTFLWAATCDVAMGIARLLGRVWGFWMAQSRYDLPVALLCSPSWRAAFANVRSQCLEWVRTLVEMCDRGFQMAFALS